MENISEMENTSVATPSQIDRWQRGRQRLFKSVPPDGKVIKYLGKKFLVFPDTFWPFMDSHPLVKNFRIERGDSVLDVGTGAGVIAVFACYSGAGRVVAVDINQSAIRSATHNAEWHGFANVMTVKQSDLFENVGQERFDVVTANFPFRDKPAHDVVARSQWDTGFRTNTQFFAEVGDHLKPNGRIYFVHSNFGALEAAGKLANAAGLSIRAIGKSADRSGKREFYAFELRRI